MTEKTSTLSDCATPSSRRAADILLETPVSFLVVQDIVVDESTFLELGLSLLPMPTGFFSTGHGNC